MENIVNIPSETPERHEPTSVNPTPQTGPLPQVIPNTQPRPIEISPGRPVNPEEKSYATQNLMSLFDDAANTKYYKKYLKYKSKYITLKNKI